VKRRTLADLAAALAVASIAVGFSWGFAVQQEVWLDETTQLAGLSLGPVGVLPWLAGADPDRFAGLSADRMPPLSYWVGWLWSQAFGLSEASLRALGVALGAAAALLVFAAARRLWGRAAGCLAGLSFALSPNVIVSSVDIRAYPLFLACAASACWFISCLLDTEKEAAKSAWVGLALSCVAASYSHFFGLVLTGAVFAGLLFVALRRRSSLKPLFVCSAAIALAGAGLWPFILASMRMSSSAGQDTRLPYAVIRILYRTLGGHPSLSVYKPLMLAEVLGTALALGLALCFARPREAARALALSVAAGMAVAVLTRPATAAFDPLTVSYSVWMVPFLAVAIGSVLSIADGRRRRVALAAASLLLIANAGGALVLLAHGSAFAHSAGDRVNDLVKESGNIPDTVVIHDNAGAWAHAFCPLRYTFGPGLRQYLAEPGARGDLTLRELPDLRAITRLSELKARRLLLVTFRHQSAESISAFIHTGYAPAFANRALFDALNRAGWVEDRGETLMAQGAEEVHWFSAAPRNGG
jgi:hypothetical protein